ncbi:MAG: chromophore lyase CpcT/CpeT [Planctomycetota bacterium]
MTPCRSAAVLLLALAGCAMPGSERDPELTRLAEWMTGSFSSAAQAEAQPEDYFDIRLEMTPIWTDRADGPWLYVEQAAAEALDRPYRQRIYHLVPAGDFIRSDVYLLPGDPLAFAGAWRTPEVFTGTTPEDLELRTGCSIWLQNLGGVHVGATRGRSCESSLGDAAYATSEVTVTAGRLTSWDRGFDESGVQAWGATAGAYEFLRVDG